MDEPLGHLVLDHRHDRNDDEQIMIAAAEA